MTILDGKHSARAVLHSWLLSGHAVQEIACTNRSGVGQEDCIHCDVNFVVGLPGVGNIADYDDSRASVVSI